MGNRTMPAPPNFDRIARIYRWCEYAALGPTLARVRDHFLPMLGGAEHAFVLGDGDGRFTAKLLAENPRVQITAVDASAIMLDELRKRSIRYASRLTTLHDDARTTPVPDHADLIVTHFFLDCLTQQESDALAGRIADACAHGALWVVSDFGVPAASALRPFAAVYVRALYAVFGLLTGLTVNRLPDPQASLTKAGFRFVARQHQLFGLVYTELWQRG